MGALSWDHPGNGEVSLESQVTFPRGSTRYSRVPLSRDHPGNGEVSLES